MMHRIQHRTWAVAQSFWPPLEARSADKVLDERIGTSDQRYDSIVEDLVKRLPSLDVSDHAISWIDTVFQSEQRRRESVETKASTLLGSLGIEVSLVSFATAILGRPRNLPPSLATILAVAVTLAIIHFVSAVNHSVRVSQVGALYLPSAQGVESMLSHQTMNKAFVSAAQKYAYVKLNEPILTKKTNHLSVAQLMYRRGVFLLAGVLIASILYSYTTRESESKPGAGVSPEQHLGGPFR